MIRLFKHYIPHAVLLLGLVDLLALFFAAEGGWIIRYGHVPDALGPFQDRLFPNLSFAVALQFAMIAVGCYGTDALQSLRFAISRLLVAISLGIILLALLLLAVPMVELWRSVSVIAMTLAFGLLVCVRLMLGRLLGGEAFKRRLLVLGAGPRAARIEEVANRPGAGFSVTGYVAMNDGPQEIAWAINRRDIESLADHVVRLRASEVVLALEERRNALPLADLLRIKTTGVHVNELSTFMERETGRIDLDSINPSWLIFSDGFSSGRRLSGMAKRMFDIVASGMLLVATAPLILLCAALVRLESPGGSFYRQQRIGLFGVPFNMIKLRSMRHDAEAGGEAIWAQANDPRITRVGALLRMTRIDELPQAWSVLKGEMSFVGPRPERPSFVADLESKIAYYAERHMVKPGITGWAQINYPYGASIEDARAKLEYDLYYAKNYTPFLDVLILLQTVRVVLWPEGVR